MKGSLTVLSEEGVLVEMDYARQVPESDAAMSCEHNLERDLQNRVPCREGVSQTGPREQYIVPLATLSYYRTQYWHSSVKGFVAMLCGHPSI